MLFREHLKFCQAMKKYNHLFLAALLHIIPLTSSAQFDYEQKIEGMAIRLGASKGFDDPNAAREENGLATCISLYHRHNLNTKNESLIPFHYLITEFSFGSKRAYATVNSRNEIARVDNNYIEVALIVPLTWELSNKVALNAGLGGSLLYITDQDIRAHRPLSENPYQYNSLKGTILSDFHILILMGASSNLIIGCRVVVEPSNYAFAEVGGYIGFSLPTFNTKTKKSTRKRT